MMLGDDGNQTCRKVFCDGSKADSRTENFRHRMKEKMGMTHLLRLTIPHRVSIFLDVNSYCRVFVANQAISNVKCADSTNLFPFISLDHWIFRFNSKPIIKAFTGNYFLLSLVAILVFGAGCVTRNAPPFNYATDDQTLAAKDPSVPTGKSVIYVLEDHQMGAEQTILQVDQKNVCRLTKKTFYRAVLEPGNHQLALRYEGNWVDGAGQVQAPIRIGKELIINAEAGQNYYFAGTVFSLGNEVKIKFEKLPNWMGRSQIRYGFHLTGELINP